ncbi:MAG TPA: hypothetical protein VK622_14820 [Puia sp.]|nr:hypothetical protein [Puia sp.]
MSECDLVQRVQDRDLLPFHTIQGIGNNRGNNGLYNVLYDMNDKTHYISGFTFCE